MLKPYALVTIFNNLNCTMQGILSIIKYIEKTNTTGYIINNKNGIINDLSI